MQVAVAADHPDTPRVPLVVIACAGIRSEIDRVCRGGDGVEIRYLDQNLHRTPKQVAPLVQAHIDEVSAYAASIALGYGLCSNAVVGVVARRQGLIIPRCHDCIALFLGSHEAHRKALKHRPGTFYLPPDWIADKVDPLGVLERDYVPRVGYETALWAMEEELKHYTHFTLFRPLAADLAPLRARARENAAVFEKAYDEVEFDPVYFERLVHGPHGSDAFILLKPGETVTMEMFPDTFKSCGVKHRG